VNYGPSFTPVGAALITDVTVGLAGEMVKAKAVFPPGERIAVAREAGESFDAWVSFRAAARACRSSAVEGRIAVLSAATN
jgi:hypothetical protein